MATPHIEEEVLEQYAMGTLPGESISELEEHLLVCSFCQGRLVETDTFLTHFRAAATQIHARPASFWKTFAATQRAFWGVSAVVTAALLLFLITGEPRQAKTEPAVLLLQSLRGPESQAQMASGRPCLIIFDLPLETASADYAIEVVDVVGRPVFEERAGVKDRRLTVLVQKLRPGAYWVRVYRRPMRELVAEYGLKAE
jgi:hypothetical protein